MEIDDYLINQLNVYSGEQQDSEMILNEDESNKFEKNNEHSDEHLFEKPGGLMNIETPHKQLGRYKIEQVLEASDEEDTREVAAKRK